MSTLVAFTEGFGSCNHVRTAPGPKSQATNAACFHLRKQLNTHTLIVDAGARSIFQVYRVRIECHSPAVPEVVTMTITKCISIDESFFTHDDDGDGAVDEDSRDGVDDDADSEDGEDPPNPDDNPDNDCQETTK